jgi:hypothetical protein
MEHFLVLRSACGSSNAGVGIRELGWFPKQRQACIHAAARSGLTSVEEPREEGARYTGIQRNDTQEVQYKEFARGRRSLAGRQYEKAGGIVAMRICRQPSSLSVTFCL